MKDTFLTSLLGEAWSQPCGRGSRAPGRALAALSQAWPAGRGRGRGAGTGGVRANAPLPAPQHILLVQRQMAVNAEDLAGFQRALKRYADGAAAQRGCLR